MRWSILPFVFIISHFLTFRSIFIFRYSHQRFFLLKHRVREKQLTAEDKQRGAFEAVKKRRFVPHSPSHPYLLSLTLSHTYTHPPLRSFTLSFSLSISIYISLYISSNLPCREERVKEKEAEMIHKFKKVER